MGILRDMTIKPGAIAVETHGFLGATTPAVRQLLESRGYRVQDFEWAEPRFLSACVENDIRVLVETLATWPNPQIQVVQQSLY